MRIRLKLDQLQRLLAQGPISQNHWAIRLGLSKGHLSSLLSGKHLYPSARTRERMLEVLSVSFDDLFDVEAGHELPEHPVQRALADLYLADRQIGQGGMGTVYLARDVRMGRVVAVKIVSAEAVSGVGGNALLKEIIHTNRLQHHNILPVLDIGEADDSPYYVMPYVRGGSLKDLLKEKTRLPVWRVLAITQGVAAALDYAHRSGVLHCDVKPANVLLSDDHAYLADFGIARVIQAEVWSGEWRAEYDSGAGTPAYVSPEQARGDADIDGRSDVYSLACMVFEMLTGKPPFEGETTLATVAQRFTGEPPRITTIAPGLSSELAEAVYHAMAVDRDARTGSAGAFVEECRRAISHTETLVGVSEGKEVSPIIARPRVRGRLADFVQDVRFAIRGISHAPGFALAVTLTLGLGIGANAVMFGLIDHLLLRPPAAIEKPESVKRLLTERIILGKSHPNSSLAWMDLVDFRGARSFSGVAGVFSTRLAVDRGKNASEVSALLTTANYFPVLGVKPYRGRFYSEEEEKAGAAGTAVLSYGYWQRRFRGQADVIGQTLRLGRGTYTVIGITPPGFSGIDLQKVDLFLPMRAAAQEAISGDWETSRGFYWVKVVARMAPGVSLPAAEAEATSRHRVGRADVKNYDHNVKVIVAPLLESRGPMASSYVNVSIWLTGVSVTLLVIACANVMNLLLARLTHRDREMAVRLALGAGRGRLISQLVTETLVLTILAASCGLVLAHFGGALLQKTLLPDVPWSSPLKDLRIIGFTVSVTLLAGLISGVLPALRSSRPNLAASLKVGRGGPALHRSALRTSLLVFQASLSVVLLIAAGLFVRSLTRVKNIDSGMDLGKLVVASMDLEAAGYTPAAAASTQRDVIETMARLPGVARVAGSVTIPFMSSWSEDLTVPGVDSMPTLPDGGPYISAVTSNYFEVVGTPILKGRGFLDTDRVGTERVAVVNETMARMVWPGQDALGKCIVIGGDSMPCTTVVGVAGEAPRWRLLHRESLQYYVPAGQFRPDTPFSGLFIRATRDAESIAAPVRHAIQTAAPDLPYIDVRPMWDLAGQEIRSWQLGATLFTIFGGLAMVVAAIGLYSVISFTVARRTQEFGIRTALGASMSNVLSLVLRGGMKVVLAGMLLGFLIALIGGRWLAPLLYETSAHDPLVFGVVGVLLLVSAVVACLIPAVRATRVQPMEALRSE
ncbi:MAG: ADOP family duplicated permease [Gemmatimonadota bacterium]